MSGLETIWARTLVREADACWMWQGSVGQRGHPSGSVNGRSGSMRRHVWQLIHGCTLSDRERVTTTCGTTLCVNPAHLALTPWHNDDARFSQYVQKADGDACWLWTGAMFRRGYGAFRKQGKIRHATHVMWELTHGPFEKHVTHGVDANVIMHTCDNPPCVRPDHLRLGTHQENHDDMVSKGRAAWQRDPRGFSEKISKAARRRSLRTPCNTPEET